jgi:hypothetical protein
VDYTRHGWRRPEAPPDSPSTENVSTLTNDNMLPFASASRAISSAYEGYLFRGVDVRPQWTSDRGRRDLCPRSTVVEPADVRPGRGRDLLVQDQVRTIGGACYNSFCQMMDSTRRWSEHVPLLILASSRRAPQRQPAMSVEHAGTFLVRATGYPVTVWVAGAVRTLRGPRILLQVGLDWRRRRGPPSQLLLRTDDLTPHGDGVQQASGVVPVEVLPLTGLIVFPARQFSTPDGRRERRMIRGGRWHYPAAAKQRHRDGRFGDHDDLLRGSYS